MTLPQKNGHRIKMPSSKLTILVSSCWGKNFIRNNAHNFFILSLVFLKVLIVSVAFFLGHPVLLCELIILQNIPNWSKYREIYCDDKPGLIWVLNTSSLISMDLCVWNFFSNDFDTFFMSNIWCTIEHCSINSFIPLFVYVYLHYSVCDVKYYKITLRMLMWYSLLFFSHWI